MELPELPERDEVDRYRQAVMAGHSGDVDLATVLLDDPSPVVRQGALAALARLDECTPAHIVASFNDVAAVVRSRAAELSTSVAGVSPAALLNDPEPSVVETAAFACGEIEWVHDAPVAQLAHIATTHDDALCRESAAAALGAIGDPAGLDAVLVACEDRVTVRRRAMLALAAFDDPRAEAMLTTALDDKDWQVRQAAEDLLGVGRTLDAPPDPDAYAG